MLDQRGLWHRSAQGWAPALLSGSVDLEVGWGGESPIVTPENQAFSLQNEIAPLRALKKKQSNEMMHEQAFCFL